MCTEPSPRLLSSNDRDGIRDEDWRTWRALRSLFPLPKGEGQSEGEGVGGSPVHCQQEMWAMTSGEALGYFRRTAATSWRRRKKHVAVSEAMNQVTEL